MPVLAVNQEVCALDTDLREGRPVGTVALLRIDRIAETVPDHVYFQKMMHAGTGINLGDLKDVEVVCPGL